MYHVSAQGVDERIIIIIKCADLISIISLSYDKPTTKKKKKCRRRKHKGATDRSVS